MTAAEFMAFYPQFDQVFPEIVVSSYVEEANLRFSDFGEDAEAARRLYVAHRLTLYAKTMPATAGAVSYSALASAGAGCRITSEQVDGVAVTYSSGTSSSASSESEFADFDETIYGMQLLALIRMYSYTRYIP